MVCLMNEKSKESRLPGLIDLDGMPASKDEIEQLDKRLGSLHRHYMNYVAAVLVLACGVSYRVISLDFEMGVELFEVSVNIGLWLGMFTGFMASGNRRSRIKVCMVSIIVSASCSVFAAMLTVLFLGYLESWVMSINILASALGSMWVLTHYDELQQARESLRYINDGQLAFFNKAAEHFEEIESFRSRILRKGRRPLTGEYRAMLEWIHNRANSNSQS